MLVVAKQEGIRWSYPVGVGAAITEAAAQLVAEAVLGGHQRLAGIVARLLHATLYLACSMMFIEVLGTLVDDVGTIVQ